MCQAGEAPDSTYTYAGKVASKETKTVRYAHRRLRLTEKLSTGLPDETRRLRLTVLGFRQAPALSVGWLTLSEVGCRKTDVSFSVSHFPFSILRFPFNEYIINRNK